SNLEFHRTLYLRAQAPAMLAMVETVWLQLGPTMRQLYSKMRFSGRLGHHRAILKALSDGDEQALQSAIGNDVTQGLRMLTV
ncbi:MAG: DNA-binding GntR family transcriptional regulator, partial [Paracoccaceae bacterium]